MDTAIAEAIRKRTDLINFELARKVYEPKANTYAKHSFFQVPGMLVDDMHQELLAVLWTAVRAYDPHRGRTFNSFVQMLWRNKIGSLRREAGAQRRKAEIVSLDVEAVQLAIDSRRSIPSAEDAFLLRQELQEEWDSLSVKARKKLAG